MHHRINVVQFLTTSKIEARVLIFHKINLGSNYAIKLCSLADSIKIPWSIRQHIPGQFDNISLVIRETWYLCTSVTTQTFIINYLTCHHQVFDRYRIAPDPGPQFEWQEVVSLQRFQKEGLQAIQLRETQGPGRSIVSIKNRKNCFRDGVMTNNTNIIIINIIINIIIIVMSKGSISSSSGNSSNGWGINDNNYSNNNSNNKNNSSKNYKKWQQW